MISIPKLQFVSLALILFTATSFIFLNTDDSASIEIYITDCRDPESHSYFTPNLTILKDGQDFQSIDPGFGSKVTLKDLEIGTYTIYYQSIFGNKEKQEIVISESKSHSVTICINQLDYSASGYSAVIDELEVGESYRINYESQGCFHSDSETISIGRIDGHYLVSWGDTSKILSQTEHDLIRQFEIEMNYMKGGGCTTTDTYTVLYKEKQKEIHDRTCEWNGWDFLTKQLFGEY
ncbi:MAG: hypothetical protein V4604_02770 [Bacteroidota bacterium]